jgi:hypothetical protein
MTFTTFVVRYTDLAGQNYCTRIISDNPVKENTPDWRERLEAMYRAAGYNILQIAEVPDLELDTEHVGSAVQVNTDRITRIGTSLANTRRLLFAAAFLAGAAVLGLAYQERHMRQQDQLLAELVAVEAEEVRLLGHLAVRHGVGNDVRQGVGPAVSADAGAALQDLERWRGEQTGGSNR